MIGLLQILDYFSPRKIDKLVKVELFIIMKKLNEEMTKTEIKDLVKDEISKVLKAELKKMVEEELKKVLKDRNMQNEIGDISKEILKKLYKDLSLHHTYVIDRVKL